MQQAMLKKWQDEAIHEYKNCLVDERAMWMQQALLSEIALRLENNEKMNEQEEQEQTQLKLLVIKAYKLLEDISHPYRPVERSEVNTWLEDAKPFMEKMIEQEQEEKG